MARRTGRLTCRRAGELTPLAYHHTATLTTATSSTHGHAVAAAAPKRGPAIAHQDGAYRHATQPAATMITGQAASTSRLIATNAAVAGTRLCSMPASRAGSPPIRSGVRAQAASP